MMVQAHEEMGEDEVVNEEIDGSLKRATTTATSLDAEQDRGNINKTQSKATLNKPSSIGTNLGVNTPQSGEDILKLNEFMDLCTSLQNRILERPTKLSLWYPKDSPFNMMAYTDSDYAGASLDRKSTTGGCQFLGCRLISWQFKKQTMVANSTTKAEYATASSCCGQEIDGSLKRATTTATSLDVEHDRGNINKTQSKATLNKPSSIGTNLGVNTPQSGEDIRKLNEFMDLCTSLQNRVFALEATKTSQAQEINSLKRRVKKLKKKQSAVEEVNAASITTPVSAAATTITTAITPTISMDEITLAKELIEIKTSRPKAKRIDMQEPSKTPTPTPIVSSHNHQRFRTKGNMFVDMDTKVVENSKKTIKIAQEGSLKRARDELEQKIAKKQRMEDENESTKLKRCLEIVLDDVTIDATPYLLSLQPLLITRSTKKGGKVFSKSSELMGTGIETVVYADFDHVGDYVDRKSTSGICTFMGCCLTSWFSKKQTTLAISTTEGEYVSAEKVCQQALWMKQALIDYDVRLDDVTIMCENSDAIDLSKNPVQHSRTKHIEILHHFLRDNVQKGHISIEKVSSIENIVDILTKPFKRESFNYLRLGLGMMEHIS
nr:retrovirus-related Pol polyprotein from transposon TNT 1-94 [Tanacetum cinerariifolium]